MGTILRLGRRIWRWWAAGLVVGLDLGCTGPLELPKRDVAVELSRDTVLAYVDSTTIELAITVVLRNNDYRDVYLKRCGHSLQRRTEAGWQPVYSQPCGRTPTYPLLVSAHGSGVVGVGFRMRRDSTATTWPDRDLAGDYRVVVAALGILTGGGGGVPLPPADCTSPPIVVQVRRVPQL